MLAVTSDPRSASPAWHPFPSQSRVQAFLANTQNMPWGWAGPWESVLGSPTFCPSVPGCSQNRSPSGTGLCQPESPPVGKDYIWKSGKPNLNPGFSTDYWVIWGQSFDLFGKTEITPVLSPQSHCVCLTQWPVLSPLHYMGQGSRAITVHALLHPLL